MKNFKIVVKRALVSIAMSLLIFIAIGMYFDIKLQMLKCRSCGSRISVTDYKTDINAEEHIFETPVYICKSCGAEIITWKL